MKTGKKVLKKNELLVEIKLTKGEKTKISWKCLSALVESSILSTYAKILLNEENLHLYEDIVEQDKTIEGECFEI